MIAQVLILVLVVTASDGARGAAAKTEAAADRITLKDGSVVLGLVTSATTGARGSVEFLVRRDWAEKNLADHLRAGIDRHSQESDAQRTSVANGWRPGGRSESPHPASVRTTALSDGSMAS